MKIVESLPPIWNQIVGAGMNPNPNRTVFTYGDTIYNPSGMFIPNYLMEHETVHSKQQGANPDAWWGRYMMDAYFRINQEAEAYGAQYSCICKIVKDRNNRARILHEIAGSLSGPTYGNVITHSKAMEMIKSKAKV